ncbi:hypothetical protein ACFRQM_13840 [Streptomyces sp. NPDC056831]|uniref:hypothetical protein n=1 Tax=Streptomyces sp. NPDC056831 TaxID=3345954 RepID=UPI003681731F
MTKLAGGARVRVGRTHLDGRHRGTPASARTWGERTCTPSVATSVDIDVCTERAL